MKEYNLLTVLGPTAAGKTHLAVLLAQHYNGEIISADSRQVYKGLDLGTGKDLHEYQQFNIPYHLIDVESPHGEFNLFRFQNLFYSVFEQISAKPALPVLTGGSALYLNSILSSYTLPQVEFSGELFEYLNTLSIPELIQKLKSVNPVLHNTTDLTVKERIIKAIILSSADPAHSNKNSKIKSFTIGVYIERNVLKRRITARLKERLQTGMIDEVRYLLDSGVSYEKLISFGLEYKFITLYLKGQLNYNDMFQKLNSAIHQFAKRQMTWFRKMEREGVRIHWLDGADYDKAVALIEEHSVV